MCHKHTNQKSRGPSTHRANRAKCHHLKEPWAKRVQESQMPSSQSVDNTKIYEHQKSHEQKECQSHVPSSRAPKRALQKSPAKEPHVSSARIFPQNFLRKRALFSWCCVTTKLLQEMASTCILLSSAKEPYISSAKEPQLKEPYWKSPISMIWSDNQTTA